VGDYAPAQPPVRARKLLTKQFGVDIFIDKRKTVNSYGEKLGRIRLCEIKAVEPI
jgi:hypothetical protein